LYKALAAQRELIKLRQIQDLLAAGLKSVDPEIRSRCAGIANDGVTWAYLNEIERQALIEKSETPKDGERWDKPYTVPEFPSEELMMGLPQYENP
jgi:hypothetical protein